ncbi:MAG: KH domain-containing protein [Clostridia bacterium]|nr:KH domain-containing protein [Clostridia bacterium]
MDEKNVYSGKTVEEAIQIGLATLQATEEQVDITGLDEGKIKLIGGVKARVKIVKKVSDGVRAVEFIDGLMDILKLNAVTELVSDCDKVEINITSTETNHIIGRHGEVLDAIQTMASAVANIGRDEYKRVVVDCENYRVSREKTLVELAGRLAKKAVERQRRVTLEPMNPYERRVIHSALAENEEVKTVSSGKEPARFVVIIPNNEKPYDGKRERSYGDRDRRDRGRGGRDRGDRGDRRPRERREGGSNRSGGGRAKREIHFGTFLGNSGNGGEQ